jgi:hypothetical protein
MRDLRRSALRGSMSAAMRGGAEHAAEWPACSIVVRNVIDVESIGGGRSRVPDDRLMQLNASFQVWGLYL